MEWGNTQVLKTLLLKVEFLCAAFLESLAMREKKKLCKKLCSSVIIILMDKTCKYHKVVDHRACF